MCENAEGEGEEGRNSRGRERVSHQLPGGALKARVITKNGRVLARTRIKPR